MPAPLQAVSPRPGRSGLRLAELLGAPSLAVDLGLGQPMEHLARSCLLTCGLGERAGLDDDQRAASYYVAMLGWVGCIADSAEAASWFGDDIAYRADVYDLDMKPLPFLGYLLRRAGAGRSPVARAGARAALVATGARGVRASLEAHCQVTAAIAGRLGFGPEVCQPLGHIFSRWDGKGLPSTVRGEQLPLVVRLWHVADVVEVHHRRGGVRAAVDVARQRRGTQFDPAVVDLFTGCAEELFAGLPEDSSWDDLVRSEPALRPELTEAEFDSALDVVADYADLKSPFLRGHSRGVAALAEAAAIRPGLAPEEQRMLRRAALVHDIGRTGVPNSIWDKAGPLTRTETERVRLHAYYTERTLARPPALAELGAVAALAHERLDGSGYHRGLPAAALPMPARVLAASDAYHAMREPRPHRPPRQGADAARELRAEVHEGRLDGDAAEAVLETAGHRSSRRRSGPAGLTARETQVLVLLARGAPNRRIARELGITPKTVGNHIEHVYAKVGIGTRAAAALFAMRQGLLDSLDTLE